ncbi:T9SS type A sorting domain-containing protein [Fulvivirga sp. 29W222]|uniref:T9SS type A sorting domain-containing protein n=1 Tax=Fulvivirga marina TaxID=2494733 RepID=A0A937KD80_9BACT|nr:T9SS type A sorting domain-containing protein [Fulvivirga marina]MBL6448189.1 T9SS type A sorting domain-containing protein [Fulvivirga marina]
MQLFVKLTILLTLAYISSYAITMGVGSADTVEYLIFTPPSYNDSQAYPLLVYLHGAQAIGPDISCSRGKGLPGAIRDNNFFNDIPMIIVAPHVKKEGSCSNSDNNEYEWNTDMINNVIDHIISNYNIDESRIFGSGISLGAKGLWDYVLAYPDRMAGIVPFSGNAPIENICTLDELAVWAFHGEVDGTIPPTGGTDRKGSQTIIDEMNSCNDKPYIPAHITILTSKGHNGWDQVYNLTSGYNIYEWLLALKRNISTDYTPLVHIGPNKTFVSPSHSLTIRSFAYDPNGTIETYNWDISGPVPTLNSGQPDITANFSSPGIYTIELTVTDDEGNINSDQVQYTVLSSIGSSPSITELRLYNGNTDLGPITNNQVVNLDSYDATLLDIVATTSNLNSRASVRFSLNDNHNFISLNEDKINTNYSIGNNNHKSYVPTLGEHTVTATAYGDRNELDQGISYEITLIYSNGPLPINLLDFTASMANDRVTLYWETSEEINNSHFEIYQGIGSTKSMYKIGEVPKKLKQQEVNYYSYTIENAPCGKLYYQLQSIDLDGKQDPSKIITLKNIRSNCDSKVYPNPITGNYFIYESKSDASSLMLTNTSGKTVRKYYIPKSETRKTILDTYGIPAGVYFLQISNNETLRTQKLIILKNTPSIN